MQVINQGEPMNKRSITTLLIAVVLIVVFSLLSMCETDTEAQEPNTQPLIAEMYVSFTVDPENPEIKIPHFYMRDPHGLIKVNEQYRLTLLDYAPRLKEGQNADKEETTGTD